MQGGIRKAFVSEGTSAVWAYHLSKIKLLFILCVCVRVCVGLSARGILPSANQTNCKNRALIQTVIIFHSRTLFSIDSAQM